jgi:hypothetical protein
MTNQKILEEIFIPASQQIKENRFAETNQAAACGGSCVGPGGCKGITDESC